MNLSCLRLLWVCLGFGLAGLPLQASSDAAHHAEPAHHEQDSAADNAADKVHYRPLPAEILTPPKVEMPKLISMPEPVYPRELKTKGISGTAVLELLIAPNGKPSQIFVYSASNDAFAKSLEEAAKNAIFSPGTANGTPTSIKIRFPYTFAAN